MLRVHFIGQYCDFFRKMFYGSLSKEQWSLHLYKAAVKEKIWNLVLWKTTKDYLCQSTLYSDGFMTYMYSQLRPLYQAVKE